MRQITSDRCSDTDMRSQNTDTCGGGRTEKKKKKELKSYLKVVLLLSSSGVVRPSFEVAQDMEEVGPCSQTQRGTFLENKKSNGG